MRFKIGDKIKAFLREDEVKILLQKAKEFNHPWYYHWVLAIYTGMRTGELFALTWDNVNLEQGLISVKFSWSKKAGLKETKSYNDRVVDIAPRLLETLKKLKVENPDSHFVLPRSRDWKKGEQARVLRTFLVGIGLRPVRFHDLRATFCTLLLIKGVEPIKVMVLGGWKNMKTMQAYMRTAGVEVRGVTKVLDL
jgi:integrase